MKLFYICTASLIFLSSFSECYANASSQNEILVKKEKASVKDNITLLPDSKIQEEITERLSSNDKKLSNRVAVIVKDGKIIVTGYLKDESDRKTIIDIINSVEHLELTDDLVIGENPDVTLQETIKDSVITGKMRAFLLEPGNGITSFDYVIKTYGEVLFIIGTAKSNDEVQKIIERTKSINGVKRVVTNITLREQFPEPIKE